MKTLSLISATVAFMVVSSAFAAPLLHGGTSGVGGGGTSIAAEFVFVGQTALSILAGEGILTSEQAEETISNTAVLGVKNLCSIEPSTGASSCLDARYLQNSRTIEFDRENWPAKKCNAKFALAAHEYLRSAGLEDSNYKFSNLFYGATGEQLKAMNQVCTQLGSKLSPAAPKLVEAKKTVVVPYRTEIFVTTKECAKLKSTGRGLSDDRAAYVLSEIKCAGESYSVIQLVPAPGFDDGGSIYTVKTKDLIK